MGVNSQLHAPATVAPGKRRGTHFIGAWVGTKAGLDGCTKSLPTVIRFPDPPSVASHYTDCAIPTPMTIIVIKIKIIMLKY